VVIKLKEKGTYKSELEIRHLVRTNNRADYDSDEVFANFREVRLGSHRSRQIVQILSSFDK